MIDLRLGDCLDVMRMLPDGCVDAVVTDPPYGLKFMGREWDHGVPGVPFWSAMLRVMKPGGYLLAFGGTRTFHRQVCAIEDAGFQIRDCLMWLYGQGFPKAKSCLKPGWEPIILAWKSSKNVPPLNIDECRIHYRSKADQVSATPQGRCTSKKCGDIGASPDAGRGLERVDFCRPETPGRYPANLVLSHHHDCNGECAEGCPVAELDRQSGDRPVSGSAKNGRPSASTTDGVRSVYAAWLGRQGVLHNDSGGASRYFYCSKANPKDRGEGNTHPTVKPTDLMRWLVRLITPEAGVVLDPFMGSGSTGKACVREGRSFIGIEVDSAYFAVAEHRIAVARAKHPLFPCPG